MNEQAGEQRRRRSKLGMIQSKHRNKEQKNMGETNQTRHPRETINENTRSRKEKRNK